MAASRWLDEWVKNGPLEAKDVSQKNLATDWWSRLPERLARTQRLWSECGRVVREKLERDMAVLKDLDARADEVEACGREWLAYQGRWQEYYEELWGMKDEQTDKDIVGFVRHNFVERDTGRDIMCRFCTAIRQYGEYGGAAVDSWLSHDSDCKARTLMPELERRLERRVRPTGVVEAFNTALEREHLVFVLKSIDQAALDGKKKSVNEKQEALVYIQGLVTGMLHRMGELGK